jgi:hypothetical protein
LASVRLANDLIDSFRFYILDFISRILLQKHLNISRRNDSSVLFKEQDGSLAASQILAFEDTWSWNQEDEEVFAELIMAEWRVVFALEYFS